MTGIAPTREAVAALDRGRHHRPRRHLAVVGSLAAAVLCLGGFGAAVYGSSPGDALYGLRGSIFGQQQVTRDVHVELAATELQQVQDLIDRGDWQAAQEKLQTVTTTVATVGDAQQKQALVDQWQQLSVKVESRDPHATVPPDAPPVILPEVPPVTSEPPSTSVSTMPTTTVSTSPSDQPTSTSPASPTSPPSSETTPSEDSTSPSTQSTPSMQPTPSPTQSVTDAPTTSVPGEPAPSSPGTSVDVPNPASDTATTPNAPVHTETTIMPTVRGSASTPAPAGEAPAVSHHPLPPVLPQLPGVITGGPQR
jgi:hypothetical protein